MTLMSLQRREVTSDAEFNDLVRCKWASFDTPHNGFHKLFWPIRGTGPTAREDSIQESIGRQIRWHRADPSSHWIKVVDTDLDMVVGGAQWIVYESNPYVEAKTNRGKISADWWPEGEGREFAEAALWMWIAPRIERMRRPHLLLNTCFVHPAHRRRGVGGLLVEWGNDKADKLGVESFVESTEDGKPLYDGYGFATMNDFNLEPTKSNPGPEWQKTAKTLLPMHGYFMWRPILGKYEEGKTVIPWEEKTNQPFSIEERRNL